MHHAAQKVEPGVKAGVISSESTVHHEARHPSFADLHVEKIRAVEVRYRQESPSPFRPASAAPLHAVHHLLGPGRELVEGVGWPGKPDHHRIAFDVPQDGDPTRIKVLTEVSDLIAAALIEDVQAARGYGFTIPVGVLGQVIDEHFELLALDSSYRDRLWFGSFQVGVA